MLHNNLQVKVFSDSDWGGDPNDRKSVGAYSLLLGPVAISWRSKKQHVTSRSSAEAEYRALADASCEILWVLNLLHDFKLSIKEPVPLFCDSKAAIDLTANPVYHARTKHVELDCHFIREKIALGLIVVFKVHTKENAADILTKGLGKVLHWSCAHKLGLCVLVGLPICGGDTTVSEQGEAKENITANECATHTVSCHKQQPIPNKILVAFTK